jgi:hypothetical protein
MGEFKITSANGAVMQHRRWERNEVMAMGMSESRSMTWG